MSNNNQAADLGENLSVEPTTHVMERGDHVEQGTQSESSTSSSEENQQPHLKQQKLDQTPNESATIMLQGPHAASEIGHTNPTMMNAPQYSQARTSLPMRPLNGNASVRSLPPEGIFNLSSENQLNVPPQTAFRAEYLPRTNIGVPSQGSAPMQVDRSARNNNYLLPLSNLPIEFRLDARPRLPHPNFSAPLGIATGGPNWASQSQNTMHDPSTSQLRPQEIQGRLNKARVRRSNFYPTSVAASYNQFPNIPIQQRRMIPVSVTAPLPNQVNALPHGQGSQGQTSNPSFLGNSLYDPIYESMGLPADPHLRLLVLNCNNNGSMRM